MRYLILDEQLPPREVLSSIENGVKVAIEEIFFEETSYIHFITRDATAHARLLEIFKKKTINQYIQPLCFSGFDLKDAQLICTTGKLHDYTKILKGLKTNLN